MDNEIADRFRIIVGDKGYSEKDHVVARRYGLFAIILQETRVSQYIELRGKQEEDEEASARRV